MADHPWTCRERCFYCGMTRNKRQPLQLCTYLALCQTRLNDNIFTYQYFLITIKFNILEWRGNYKSHEIRIWKNEGKKLFRNLYRFHFRPNLCIYSTFYAKQKLSLKNNLATFTSSSIAKQIFDSWWLSRRPGQG